MKYLIGLTSQGITAREILEQVTLNKAWFNNTILEMDDVQYLLDVMESEGVARVIKHSKNKSDADNVWGLCASSVFKKEVMILVLYAPK